MVDAQVHAVIDNGTSYTKAGFSGEEAPRSAFPTLVGKPKPQVLLNSEKNERLLGQEALEKLGISTITHPIESGVITNWEDMEKIWHHTFYNELRIAPEEHNVLLTDPPLNKEETREKITEVMFEMFNIPGLYISMQSVLAIYSTGRTSGIVVDSGESNTHFVPIHEGYPFPHAIIKMQLGGSDLTQFLIKLLIEKRYTIDTLSRIHLTNDMKEKQCYVSYDYDLEVRETNQGGSLEAKYKMPDGEEINLEYERFRCPEALFRPGLIGKEIPGIHEQCYNAIIKSDMEIRKDMYSNIVLAGGNTLFPGMPERLTKEVQKLTPSATSNKVKIIAMPERKYATWIGGSILTSLSNFQCMWITKGEYDEIGKEIVHKKCF
jgi:actin-related protein